MRELQRRNITLEQEITDLEIKGRDREDHLAEERQVTRPDQTYTYTPVTPRTCTRAHQPGSRIRSS